MESSVQIADRSAKSLEIVETRSDDEPRGCAHTHKGPCMVPWAGKMAVVGVRGTG